MTTQNATFGQTYYRYSDWPCQDVTLPSGLVVTYEYADGLFNDDDQRASWHMAYLVDGTRIQPRPVGLGLARMGGQELVDAIHAALVDRISLGLRLGGKR